MLEPDARAPLVRPVQLPAIYPLIRNGEPLELNQDSSSHLPEGHGETRRTEPLARPTREVL